MSFTPLNFHIEVEPIVQDSFISSENHPYEEKGKVISCASEVSKVTVGDTVYFDSWTAARFSDSEGKLRWLVQEENVRAKE